MSTIHSMMKAIVNRTYGSPAILKLEEVSIPIPESDELLVKVKATTVNRTDCAILSAQPFIMRFVTGLFKPKRTIQGTDFAGEISAVGKGVKKFKVGERVFGFDDVGLSSHAEYMVIKATAGVNKIPAHFNYEEAVAGAEGFHYAYNTFNKVAIQPGQKILVNGATGAIGSALVQLLKYHKAEITAVANTKNLALVKSLGANKVIDYNKDDFTETTEKYDYVFDAVGNSSFGKCKKILLPGGVYISSELGWMAQNLFYGLFPGVLSRLPEMEGKKVIFPFPADIPRSLEVVKKMMEENKFKAVIDSRYALGEIAEAYRYVGRGEKTGNVIIEVG